VASAEEDVHVDDYAHSVVAPKPTRAAPANDDIYDFQVAPSKAKTPTPAAGWDDWDDWGGQK
jgi:hypothetical protein